MFKRICSLILVSSMLMSVSASAASISHETNKNNLSFTVNGDECKSTIFKNAEAYETEQFIVVQDNTSPLTFNVDNEQINISIVIDNLLQNFSGKLYSIDGNGYYDDKMILGEFTPVGIYNILYFDITYGLDEETDMPITTIIIENIDNGEIIESTYTLQQSQFDTLMSVAQKTSSNAKDLAEEAGEDPKITFVEKIISLMQPSRHYASSINENSIQPRLSNHDFSSDDKSTGVGVSYNELDNFFSELTDNGVAEVSSTVKQILSQTGWKYYRGHDYLYAMQGGDFGGSERIICISLLSVSDDIPVEGQINFSLYVDNAHTITYNPANNTAKMLQQDLGLRLENAAVAISMYNENNNFHTATKVYDLEGSLGVENVLYSIISQQSLIGLIWDFLKTDRSTSDTTDFGTDNVQIQKYGDLIYGVGNKVKDGSRLWHSGNMIGIIGYYRTNKPFVPHASAFKFKAYSTF